MSKNSHTSNRLIGEALKHHYYSQSPEMREVVKRLYFENPEEFFDQVGSPIGLNINTDYLLPQIELEPDFRLRQLIRLFRPIPSLYAFVQSAEKWNDIYKAVEGFDDSKLIPWLSLLDTISQVQGAVEGYLRERVDEDDGLFEGYDIQAKQLIDGRMLDPNDVDDSKGYVNPLLYKGVGSSPLNALILNDPNRGHEEEAPNKLLFARLAGYVIIREEERRKPVRKKPVDEPESSSLWTEWRFDNPYQFMSLHIDKAPGRSKLAEIDRIIRDWCRQWEGATMPKNLEDRLREAKSYSQFIKGCREELTDFIAKKQPVDYRYASLLQYFVHPRIVRRGGSGGGGGGGARKPNNPGRHYWKAMQELPEIEESIYGHEVEVNDILADLSDEELDEFEEVGEDPSEEDQDRPRYKVIFGENVRSAKLELDQHIRYQRRLLASINQQLYWDGGGCTQAEMAEFVRFLKRKQDTKTSSDRNRKAALMLEVLVILGIDLDMALGIEHGPEQDEGWLKGGSRFVLGDVMDELEPKTPKINRPKLRICIARFSGQTAYIWDYPIPVRSLAKHANIKKSPNYERHSSRIAFRDQSGVIKELIRHLPRGRKSGLTPLFSEAERLEVKHQCYELLKEFNGEVNAFEISQDASGLFQKEGMRMVTFRKIRLFSRSILIRSGMEMIYVDALDWQAPKDHQSALFYYTRSSFQLAQIAKKDPWMGLQYTLSYRTGLFSNTRTQNKELPPTHYMIFGAAGLIKLDHVQSCIAKLKIALSHRPLVVSDRSQMAQFIRWFNCYSLYLSLWYCSETSHRPHRIPYGDIGNIDPVFGFITLKDKTNKEGDKNRVGRVSLELHDQMRQYAYVLKILQSWALDNALAWPNSPLVYIEEQEIHSSRGVLKKKKVIKIVPFNGSKLGAMVRQEFQAEANFHRKFISFLLRKDESAEPKKKRRASADQDAENPTDTALQPSSILDAASQTDVQIWLGHSNHGTSSYHQFGTTSLVEHAHRIEGKLAEVIRSLGFAILPIRPLRFTFPLKKANPGSKP